MATKNEKNRDKVRLRQVRSTAGRDVRTKDTIKALGLGKIGKVSEISDNPATRGMISKMRHLVEIVK